MTLVVSILNCFSKINELVIKEQITCEVHKQLSPIISACREDYNTQHVIVGMIKTWDGKVDRELVLGCSRN